YFFKVIFKLKSNLFKYLFVFSFLGVWVYLFFAVKTEFNEFFKEKEKVFEKPEVYTPTGDIYFHESNLARENGYFVWRYVAYPELKRGWNRMSPFQFDSLDRKGNTVRFTLIRYITSMGLRKDTLALQKLSKKDIENIENGIPNIKLAGASPIKIRLYEMFWEIDDYLKNGSLAGHSVMMKTEYWRTGLRIARKNFLTGVGTGDIQDAFSLEYELEGSKLKKERDRRRAHNQFIEITATLGVSGLLLLLAMLFYPLKKRKELHPLFVPFFLISFIGFFSEDSIETQMGASFFAFFYCFFVLLVKKENTDDADLADSRG
ncbi:MAG: O-antigen ligase family protein, partial [Bacteroidia bacterium]|nr:O-antigen ligase family protein [Bacteroidia bacterium]